METSRDSIKYVRPVFSRASSTSNPTKDRIDGYQAPGTYPSVDADGLSPKFDDPDRALQDTWANDFNAPDYRKALYETTEDRYVQEFWAPVDAGGGAFTFTGGPFGANGEKYLDGYGVIYLGTENKPVAIQDKRTKTWFIAPEWNGVVTAVESTPAPVLQGITNGQPNGSPTLAKNMGASLQITISGGAITDGWVFDPANGVYVVGGADDPKIKVIGRYDSEDDFAGDYLGEVKYFDPPYGLRTAA